jgi:hypothetical protein
MFKYDNIELEIEKEYNLHSKEYILSHLIPEEVVEASQIFLRDAHVLPKLLNYEEYCRCDRW